MSSTQQFDDPTEITPMRVINPFVLAIDRTLEPVEYAVIATDMGISGPRVPAVSLVGTKFTILGAKAYSSSFDEAKHVYFCVCRDAKTREIFTTSLGGQAVVDILDALVAAGFDRPLTVTLTEAVGGRYGHYYVLE